MSRKGPFEDRENGFVEERWGEIFPLGWATKRVRENSHSIFEDANFDFIEKDKYPGTWNV